MNLCTSLLFERHDVHTFFVVVVVVAVAVGKVSLCTSLLFEQHVIYTFLFCSVGGWA